jgi:hypothetical protein
MKTVLGSELSPEQQRAALARFIYRFTGEHCPEWARKPMPNGTAYPVHFATDAEWLANSSFDVTASGRLSKRHGFCESRPTWPNNPEQRAA